MKKLTVVKIGGKVINEEAELDAFLEKYAQLSGDKILVHGGGNIASQLQKDLGQTPRMVEGRRITDKETIETVSMVFAGLNKKITAKLQALGVSALGMSGADMNLIQSEKRKIEKIDYGFVGDVTKVNSAWLHQVLKMNASPVICALTHDQEGQLLNTNADTIASELAKAMTQTHAVDLVYCFITSSFII